MPGRGLEGQPVHDVACAAQVLVLVTRAAVDVDAHAGEGVGQGLGGDPDTVRQCCDIAELCGFLEARSRRVSRGSLVLVARREKEGHHTRPAGGVATEARVLVLKDGRTL